MRRHRLVGVLGDLVHEPDPECDVGAEALPREEVAPGRGAELREDEGGDHRRDDPEVDLREAEHGLRMSDRDVRARDEPRAAAERVSLNDADHGSRAGVDRLEHAEEAHRILDVLVVGEVDRGALPLDVGTGAEAGAVPGEHDGARVPDARERLGQLGDERGVERVPPIGAGQRDAQDRAVAFDPKSVHPRNHKVCAWPPSASRWSSSASARPRRCSACPSI